MLRGREAEAADQSALERFICAPPSGQTYARNVQTWVGDLLEWREEAAGRHVRVFEDDFGIAAVVAWRNMIDGTPGSGFFIYLLAVRQDVKRQGVASAVLNGLREHLGAIEPGATLSWMVAPENTASVALSQLLARDEPRSDPDWPHDLEFTASLPGNQSST